MKIKLDLGYGNPGFIQEIFKKEGDIKQHISSDLSHYFFAKHPIEELSNLIKKIHAKYNTALINENSHVVITVGAVQAIQAALSYYQSKGYNKVFIPKPYWGRFDDFTNLCKLDVVDVDSVESISFITSPNNPDGSNQTEMSAMIRDACYNWDHYSDKTYMSSDDITIFSYSKLTGFSSTRIGWAIVQNKEIAEYMQNYVNIFTSGVGIDSQISALNVLKILDTKPEIITQAKEILSKRKELLAKIIKDKNIPINILSKDGMFSYVQCEQNIIEKLNIETVTGSFFHDPRPNIHRLNIGTTEDVFQEFIKRLEALSE